MVRRPGWGRLLGLAGVLAGLGLVPMALGWSQLPDPVATHWGTNGLPDNKLPLAVLPWLHIGLVGLGLGLAGAFRVEGRPSAESVAMLSLFGLLGVVVSTSTVILNHGASSWDQASPMRGSHLAAAIFFSVLGAFLGYRVGRRWYPTRHRPGGEPAPVIEVGEGEKAMWTGTCVVRYPLLIAGMAILAILFIPDPVRWFAVPLFLGALFLSHVRVVVDDRGLRVRLGGIPVKTIELDQIEAVGVIDLEPGQWGGWGYRMAPGRSAVVLRRGEAIEVMLVSGRKFAVTIDDAETGVGLLNGLLARRARSL